MKWRINKPNPTHGDRIYKVKFAWLPTKVTNMDEDEHFIIWLDFYKEKKVYKVIKHPDMVTLVGGWVTESKWCAE